MWGMVKRRDFSGSTCWLAGVTATFAAIATPAVGWKWTDFPCWLADASRLAQPGRAALGRAGFPAVNTVPRGIVHEIAPDILQVWA